MIKWLLTLLAVVIALTLFFNYSAFITENANRSGENSISLKDAGKIIKGLRNMKEQKEKDVKNVDKYTDD